MYRTLTVLLLLITPAAAQTGPDLPPGLQGVTLIEGWREADGRHVAALEIDLAPGWYTYWRMPGEAGIPPQFDWSGSRNLATVRYEWPRPLVFDTYGMPTIGYREELVLPVVLEAARPGEPIEASLDLFFGVCNEICVPASATVRATLSAGATSEGRARIGVALANRAQSAGEAGIDQVDCRIEPRADGFDLTTRVTFAAPPSPGQVAIVESADPRLWIGMPRARVDGRRLTAHARVETLEGGAWLDRDQLRVTLLDAERMVDIRGCAAPR